MILSIRDEHGIGKVFDVHVLNTDLVAGPQILGGQTPAVGDWDGRIVQFREATAYVNRPPRGYLGVWRLKSDTLAVEHPSVYLYCTSLTS